jgi:transcriptional regulator with PAS, ATPase and Fis domain
MTVQEVKQRFGIIGFSAQLDHALDIAIQVAPTDLTVLITGESGSGKESFPQIIHHLSARKHGPYTAVNCGAIPEGTIDSELFGHEKGSFTGAHEARKGYFEVSNGGTIFLDEVAELPLQTQVRLLRVLETGEFMKVGSSKVQKTDVRVIAATNVNIPEAISKGRFREDLYYRLNTVPIRVPSLRERIGDIHLLFRKFAADFAAKYRMPSIRITEQAQRVLENYRWPGNVRQLKNVVEQISVIEKNREIDHNTITKYLPEPHVSSTVPMLLKGEKSETEFTDRDLLYKVLFDMKKDIVDMKKLVLELMQHGVDPEFAQNNAHVINKLFSEVAPLSQEKGLQIKSSPAVHHAHAHDHVHEHEIQEPEEVTEESLSLEEREKDLIRKALEKHKGKRKSAAMELGISERTLYRKINEYNIK